MLTDASTLSGLDTAFTAKVNAYEVMDYLGFPAGNEQRRIARASIDRLLVVKDDIVYCQTCVSPIWDTGLAAVALQEVDRHGHHPHFLQALQSALRWLATKQLRNEPGDWQIQRPNMPGGGWAFVSGRCLMFLGKLVDRHPEYRTVIDRCIDYLRNERLVAA